jgi:hypothetical protein
MSWVSKKGPFLKTTTLDIKGLSGHLFWWIPGTPQSKRLPQVGSKLSKAIATLDTYRYYSQVWGLHKMRSPS